MFCFDRTQKFFSFTYNWYKVSPILEFNPLCVLWPRVEYPVTPVFAKTAGLSDKTAKFQKCPANLSVCRTVCPEKNQSRKLPDSVFGWLGPQWMKIAHISCIFYILFAVLVLTEYKRPAFQQSRTLLFLSDIIFLFCLTNFFRLLDSCLATLQKISRGL